MFCLAANMHKATLVRNGFKEKGEIQMCEPIYCRWRSISVGCMWQPRLAPNEPLIIAKQGVQVFYDIGQYTQEARRAILKTQSNTEHQIVGKRKRVDSTSSNLFGKRRMLE